MRKLLNSAAHIAVWAGMYIAAATLCFAQVGGLYHHPGGGNFSQWLRAAAFAFCTAAAVYVLDRVKLRDAWLDPADAAAHPARYAYLAGRSGPMRIFMLTLLCLATWLALPLVNHSLLLASLLPLLAVLGVLLYAGRPRGGRDRPKDVLLFKNAFVAVGITLFAAITAGIASFPLRADSTLSGVFEDCRSNFLPLTISALHLFLRVLADAVLCDLDDSVADAAHGTRTLPGRLGRTSAWNLAMALRLLLAVLLAAIALSSNRLSATPMLCWAGVTAMSSLALRLAAPAKLRDWVDARFAIEAALVTLILRFLA